MRPSARVLLNTATSRRTAASGTPAAAPHPEPGDRSQTSHTGALAATGEHDGQHWNGHKQQRHGLRREALTGDRVRDQAAEQQPELEEHLRQQLHLVVVEDDHRAIADGQHGEHEREDARDGDSGGSRDERGDGAGRGELVGERAGELVAAWADAIEPTTRESRPRRSGTPISVASAGPTYAPPCEVPHAGQNRASSAIELPHSTQKTAVLMRSPARREPVDVRVVAAVELVRALGQPVVVPVRGTVGVPGGLAGAVAGGRARRVPLRAAALERLGDSPLRLGLQLANLGPELLGVLPSLLGDGSGLRG